MKRLEQEELNRIIAGHQHYLKKDIQDWVNFKAIFEYVDLSGLDFSNTDLSYSEFYNVNLQNAKLVNTDLSNSNLFRVDLRGADRTGMKTKDANTYKIKE